MLNSLVNDRRSLALLGLGAALASFLAALISQYGFGLRPCVLCIWQRYPYVVGAVFAVAALAAPRASRLALVLAALTFLVGVGLAIFHTGVEFKWWEGLSSCSAPRLDTLVMPGAGPVEPPARCDERASFFLGLSMANWNIFVSAGIAAMFALAARAPLPKS